MSGMSTGGKCYKCGGEMQTYTDWKPHDYVSGECLDCGFYYFTERGQLELDEVNEMRADNDLEPLDKLSEQKEEY